MREKNLMFFGMELLALCSGLVYDVAALGADTAGCIAAGLAFACILSAKLLLGYLRVSEKWQPALAAVCVIGSVAFSGSLFPLFAVLVLELSEHITPWPGALGISTVVITLLWFIFSGTPAQAVFTVLLVFPQCIARWVLVRLERSREALDTRQEEADRLRGRIAEHKGLITTLEHTARLEERNRIAARLHDKLGHGVSGSIVLLEAALLQMPDDMAAKSAVQQAADELRGSVDDIRAALREERPSYSEVGLQEIASELARFSSKHGRHTNLTREGRLEDVTPVVWNCIYENLKEATTNLLKHSKATRLEVSVRSENKLIRAEFVDNGGTDSFEMGMGLSNMEQRTAVSGGRCFFKSSEHSFRITMIFTKQETVY